MDKLGDLIPQVIVIIVSVGTAVLAHEAAHLIVSLLLGWKIRTLQVGSVVWSAGRLRFNRRWFAGRLSLRPDAVGVWRFRRQLQLIVVAGPIMNILIGLAALARGHVLAEWFGIMQLAIGIWNLIPSAGHNDPLGNDGNIAFRVCKNEHLLQQLYQDSTGSIND